jgi:hypothetical protein
MKNSSEELEKKLNKLQRLALENGEVIYNIAFRNAGVGIMWLKSVEFPLPEMSINTNYINHDDSWRQGLYVDRYHETLTEAIEYEIERFKILIK